MTDGGLWFVFGLASAFLVMYWHTTISYHILRIFDIYEDELPHYDLVIGVLSAREHFEHRQTIRETWMTSINFIENIRVKLWFVIGIAACLVPPEDRSDPFSCDNWNVSLTDPHDNLPAVLPVSDHKEYKYYSPSDYSDIQSTSLTIQVKHPIVLMRLGLYEDLLIGNHTIEVWLEDLLTQEKVVRAVFSPVDYGIPHENFRYQTSDHFLLPKGFEGRVALSCSCDLDKLVISPPVVQLNTAGGAIYYEQDTRSFLSNINKSYQPSLVSFMFSIHDRESLERHVSTRAERLRKWLDSVKDENRQIAEEMKKTGDVMMVDITDSYRNLPDKLVHFHNRLHQICHPKFVMKTDDDCFVNLSNVIDGLKLINETKNKMIWWGRFREQWQVELTGKWRERTYTADVYPRFACGTGSIVSDDISEWLAENSDRLHLFQGEDVSMGIWLSAIGVNYIQDKRWQCENTCEERSLAISELSPREITQMWTNHNRCGRICDCDKTPDKQNGNL